MKAKEAERLSVLRMMKAAVKNKEIELIQELDDAQVLQILMSLIKQRKDSIEQFTKGDASNWPKRSGRNQGDRAISACGRYR